MWLQIVLASAISSILLTTSLAADAMDSKTPAPTPISPQVKAGDQWDYQIHSNLGEHASLTQSYVVEHVTAGNIEAKSHMHSSSGGQDQVAIYNFNPAWRVLEGPKGKVIKYEGGGEPFPAIAVGKDWTSELSWQPLDANMSFKWFEHGHVVAWESVKLADGRTYDAYRITYRRESAAMESNRIQALQAGMTTHKLVEHIVDWYAPAVNRYVKRTFEASRDGTIYQDFNEELVKYTRGE